MSYDPTIGRWMQQDPDGYIDGPNTYQAERSSPVGHTDPAGTDRWPASPYFFGVDLRGLPQGYTPPSPPSTQPSAPASTPPGTGSTGSTAADKSGSGVSLGDAAEWLFVDGQYNPFPLAEHEMIFGIANVCGDIGAIIGDIVTSPIRVFSHDLDNQPLLVTQMQRKFNTLYKEPWENFLHGPEKEDECPKPSEKK